MSEEKCNHYDTGGICCSDGAFKYKYCKDINDCYYKQLQTAKEENEKLTIQNTHLNTALGARRAGKKTFIDLAVENDYLAQQNKQMRENINNIKNLCSEDWEDMTVDKFQNQLLQSLKGVE